MKSKKQQLIKYIRKHQEVGLADVKVVLTHDVKLPSLEQIRERREASEAREELISGEIPEAL